LGEGWLLIVLILALTARLCQRGIHFTPRQTHEQHEPRKHLAQRHGAWSESSALSPPHLLFIFYNMRQEEVAGLS